MKAAMKCSPAGWLLGLLLIGGSSAQVVVPAMPGKMGTRAIGGSTSGGVEVMPKGEGGGQTARYTTYFVLSEVRPWTSVDGQTLQAKLIAFEDLVVAKPSATALPPAPVPPANPTVVRNGKIRLLARQKPFELALDRLTKADRDVVEKVRASHAKTPPSTPP